MTSWPGRHAPVPGLHTIYAHNFHAPLVSLAWKLIYQGPWLGLQVDRYDARLAGDYELKSACLDLIHKVKTKKTTFKGKQTLV